MPLRASFQNPPTPEIGGDCKGPARPEVKFSPALHTLPPPRVQKPAMFDRGTRGRFFRALFPLNLTAEPGVGSCAQP